MAVYSIPVTWTRQSGSQEVYNGSLSLANLAGNDITGKFTSLGGNGTTVTNDIILYWNYLEVNAEVTEGTKKYTATCRYDGKYYPGGRSYGYNIDMSSVPFEPASNYSIKLSDKQSMFVANSMTKPSSINIDITKATAESPSNIRKTGDYLFNHITFAWDMVSSNKVDIEVLDGDVVVFSRSNYTSSSVTVPAGILSSTNVTFRIRSYFALGSTKIYSAWVSYKPSGLQSVRYLDVENFRFVGTTKNIEEPMIFQWDLIGTTVSGVSYLTEFEFYQNGTKVYSIATNSSKLTVKANTFKDTSNIDVKYKTSAYISTSYNEYNSVSSQKSYSVSGVTSLKPVINDFTLDGLNLDYDITIIPDCTGADYYEWNTPTDRDVGTTIGRGLLKYGNNSIMLIAYKRTSTGSTVSSSFTKKFDITRDEPTVYSLEPNNINVNIMQASTISFATNQYIDGWELLVNGDLYATGTGARSIPIPQNTFIKGVNGLELNAWYAPKYNVNDIRSTAIEAYFTGYGKPALPILDSSIVYNTATPTFTWTVGNEHGDDQTSYEVKIIDKLTSEVVENKVVVSNVHSYTMTKALENNKEYRVSVSIKNKYDMWSDWSTKDISTNFNNLPIPTLTLSNTKTSITIRVDALQPVDFKEVKIYRSDDINTSWTCIANNLNSDETIVDYVPQPNTINYYKARLYDRSGGYSESIIYKSYFSIRHYNIVSVLDFGNNIQLKSAISSFTPVTMQVIKTFAGNRKPAVFKNRTRYLMGTMSCTLTNTQLHKIEKSINESELFCYRDWRGRKVYCFIEITNINYIEAGLNDVSMQLTEVGFREDNMFTGLGYKKIVYLDGSYMLDGSVDMSGYDLTAKRVVIYNAPLR